MDETRAWHGLVRLSGPILVGLVGISAAWVVASLWMPFGWDHGILAAVGDVIVRGGMPYRDGWDMKGPLAFYAFALAQWMFGHTMAGIRIVDAVLLVATCLALARIVARASSVEAGRWAAVAFLLWYASMGWFFVAQPDGWVSMLVVLGLAPLLRPGPPLASLLWSGIAVGACALIKPFYLAFLGVPAAFVLLTSQPRAVRARALGLLCLAAAAPVLVTGWWFLRQGAWDSLVEVHLRYAGAYADSLRPDMVARRVFNYFWSNGAPTPAGAVAVVLPAVGVGAWSLLLERRQLGVTVVAWLAIALGCVVIQGKFWVYHWGPTFPPFVVLASAGLHRLIAARERHAAGLAVVSIALFFGTVAVTPAVDVVRWLALVTGIRTEAQHQARHVRRYYNAADEVEAAKHIQDRTAPVDQVVVWGNDATINFLSGRSTPTRFVFSMPLTRDVDDALRAEYRREYLAAVGSNPPRYFVIGQPHDGSRDKAAVLRSFPDLLAFIEARYRLERTVGFLEIYRRADE